MQTRTRDSSSRCKIAGLELGLKLGLGPNKKVVSLAIPTSRFHAAATI